MTGKHIFISHASADDEFVKQLREMLESYKHPVWDDARSLRGGAKLAPVVEQAIKEARQVIAVLSIHTVNSRWVRREIDTALAVEKHRKADGYRVIPLLLPGLEPAALENWFGEEPVGIRIEAGPNALNDALPDILAALGERSPTDAEPPKHPEDRPPDELVLTLSDPKIETHEGKRRVAAPPR